MPLVFIDCMKLLLFHFSRRCVDYLIVANFHLLDVFREFVSPNPKILERQLMLFRIEADPNRHLAAPVPPKNYSLGLHSKYVSRFSANFTFLSDIFSAFSILFCRSKETLKQCLFLRRL